MTINKISKIKLINVLILYLQWNNNSYNAIVIYINLVKISIIMYPFSFTHNKKKCIYYLIKIISKEMIM